jgi:DNA-binding NarL/FixJ family response regulator
MLTVETIGRILLRGKTIRQIARDLKVSRNTVRGNATKPGPFLEPSG